MTVIITLLVAMVSFSGASSTTATAQSVDQIRDRVNQGTVGIMCGRTSASFLYFCEDIASVLNDDIGYSLRVIPMVGSGAVRNVEDILYLKGVDLAMTFADTLDFMEKQGVHSNIKSRVRYVTRLWDTELHIVASKKFKSIYDLEGEKVNFSSIGSGTYLTMTNLFDAHGLEVDVQSDKKSIARERLKKGEIAAMASNSAVPWSFAEDFDEDDNVHLIDIPPDWVPSGYETTTLSSEVYPNLIAKGETVRTLRNPAVLLAYNWDTDHPRCGKVQRFVAALNEKFPELLNGSYEPKWQDVDMKADVDYLERWDKDC
jgi:TRAP transporter TAXI family solute receptor